jgi:hypothetical protein
MATSSPMNPSQVVGAQALLSRGTAVIQAGPILFHAPFKGQSFPVTVRLYDLVIAGSCRFTILNQGRTKNPNEVRLSIGKVSFLAR